MKKSTFVAMILGTIGGILFALGMCMALIPEWNAFQPGVCHGCDRRSCASEHGICLTMVWSNMILGIVIGIVGIVVLLSLIPLTKGLK